MKQTHKRLSALLLAVCLVLSMTVPAVFAADPEDTITYLFKRPGSKNITDQSKDSNGSLPYGTQIGDTSEGNPELVFYARPIHFQTRTQVYSSRVNIKFEKGSYGSGLWVAFKINVPTAENYNLAIYGDASNGNVGKADIFVLDGTQMKPVCDIIDPIIANTQTTGTETVPDGTADNLITAMSGILANTTMVGVYESEESADAKAIGSYNFTQSGSYYLVLRSSAGQTTETCNVTLTKLELTPAAEEATNVAQVGNETFADVQEAIEAAAAANSSVELLDNVTVDGTLTVKAGATLDLAGYILTADKVQCEPNAKVTDRKDGEGLLAAEVTLQANNGQLPLHDAADNAKGYRFFNVTVEEKDNGKPSTEGNVKVRFKVNFTNTDAYNLIANNDTGMTINGAFEGDSTASGSFRRATDATAEAFAKAWANEAAGKNGAILIYMEFSGLDDIETLRLTPSVSCAGVIISGTAQSVM